MTTIPSALRAPIPGSLAELSRFRSPRTAGTVEGLTPFLPPATAEADPVLRASDRGEQTMLRLRHPFTASPPVS